MTTARAMILAAGFGTRLGALTEHRPKPMIPICGVPLVRWSALWLRHHGIEDVAVNLHHLGAQIERELGDGSGLGLNIRYSHEEGMILGTGGGLRHARALLDPGDGAPIVIVNGKILLDLDLGAVLDAHRRTGAEATMVLRPDPNAAKWGSLQTDAAGRVVRLLGDAPSSDPTCEPTSPPLMFTGVHVFEPRFLDRIPDQGEQCVIRTAYRQLFNEGKGLYGVQTDDYWWEHSTQERYLQGMRNVLDGAVSLPFAPHPVTGVSASARVSPSATVVPPVWIGPEVEVGDGATVGPYVQLERGASVAAGASVRDVIAWDGATLEGELTEQVVL